MDLQWSPGQKVYLNTDDDEESIEKIHMQSQRERGKESSRESRKRPTSPHFFYVIYVFAPVLPCSV